MTDDNGGGRFSFTQIEIKPDHGHGRGLNNLADAFPAMDAATLARTSWGDNRPLSRVELVAAWYRGERDEFGLVEAAADEQTADDLRLVANCVRACVRAIVDGGRVVTPTMRDEATGAGLAAVVAWRNGASLAPPVTSERIVEAVACVAWRAVSDELSRDDKGRTVALSTVSDEWLAGAVEPLAVACVAGLESRSDKAARWVRERGQANRRAALPVKVETFRHGHARRRNLVDRIEAAAARLIDGDSVDTAAAAVGFKARMHGGKVKEQAGVQLARAARAVGLNFSLVQPSNGATEQDEFNPYRRTLALEQGTAVAPCKVFPTATPQPPRVRAVVVLRAGGHCGAACIAAAAVRSVVVRGASRARLVRQNIHGGLRYDWRQLAPAARLAALPAGQRVALLAVAAGRLARGTVVRRGLLAV
ncbi:MAG TPA: hypothetical protein VK742_01085 [Candidatus Sulfotelmatobacter sp.]|nr:hypothetical protein [Candidatus Sulfotelmatobacter sp.]